MKEPKYLYIEIRIVDGEYEFTQRCLLTTYCKNINFAAEWYTAHFWGYGKIWKNNWWEWASGLMGKWTKCEEISKKEYEFLENLFY